MRMSTTIDEWSEITAAAYMRFQIATKTSGDLVDSLHSDALYLIASLAIATEEFSDASYTRRTKMLSSIRLVTSEQISKEYWCGGRHRIRTLLALNKSINGPGRQAELHALASRLFAGYGWCTQVDGR